MYIVHRQKYSYTYIWKEIQTKITNVRICICAKTLLILLKKDTEIYKNVMNFDNDFVIYALAMQSR